MERKLFKRSVVWESIKAHPVLFLLALFSVASGAAAGITSGKMTYDGIVLTKAVLFLENGASYDIIKGMLHACAANLLLYASVSLVGVHKALLPLSLIAFFACGFFCGFTYPAFFSEFNAQGILYRLFFVLSDTVLLASLMLSFIRNVCKNSEKTEANIKKECEFMLLFLSIGMEGLVIPLTLRILLY